MPVTLRRLFQLSFEIPLELISDQKVGVAVKDILHGLYVIALTLILCNTFVVLVCLIPITVPGFWVYFKCTEGKRIERELLRQARCKAAMGADI